MNIAILRPRQPAFARPVIASLLMICLLCVLPLVSACGVSIHQGGNDIAFLRAGAIWAIQPDGSNARQLTTGSITSLGWSPDHHQVLFRLLVKSNSVPLPGTTQATPDAESIVEVVGINGAFPLVLTRTSAGLLHSDAWWNPGGNRLLYREEFSTSLNAPAYFVSQSDQPAGIARKGLLDDASIPVLSSAGHQVAVIDAANNLRLGAPAAMGSMLASGALLTFPGTQRPAHLLWQPHHDALLYTTLDTNGIKLVLIGLDSKQHWSLTVPALLDAAFSPDGSLLLVRTPTQFEVFSVGSATAQDSWPESDPYALPWWSPDSQRLLVQDQAGLTFVDVHSHVVQQLVTSAAVASAPRQAPTEWHPSTADPWNADGSQFVFAASTGDSWQSKPLPAPHGSQHGLYVASLNGDSVGAPLLIDSGNDILSAWSYLDPSCTFLVGD